MSSLTSSYQLNRAGINVPKEKQSAKCCQQTQQEASRLTDADLSPRVEEVRVDMADMKVACKHVELFTSVGSCVAICLHDPVLKCGGLAHVMLPHASNPHGPLPSKYADTAIPALLQAMKELTGKDGCFLAKIAGGANMFHNLNPDRIDIGTKNVNAVKATLLCHDVRLAGEDVGGFQGRRVHFNVFSGETNVKSFNGAVKKL